MSIIAHRVKPCLFCGLFLQSESVKYFLDNLDWIGQLVSNDNEALYSGDRSSSYIIIRCSNNDTPNK